jgi:hypothetical protein
MTRKKEYDPYKPASRVDVGFTKLQCLFCGNWHELKPFYVWGDCRWCGKSLSDRDGWDTKPDPAVT